LTALIEPMADGQPTLAAPPDEERAPAAGLRRWLTVQNAMVALLASQFLMIAVFGSLTALRFPVWAPIDESAHFSYVQDLAEHHAMPVLGKTLTSSQVIAIAQGVYPKKTTTDPRKIGLAGLSYEAFEPPLYYLVAVPFYDMTGNYRTKVTVLRFLGLGLTLVCGLLLMRLARVVLGPRRWLYGAAGGLVVLMLPGVIVRMTTVSYLPLAVVLAIACVTDLWLALRHGAPWRLLTSGALLGLAVLTNVFLVDLVPVFVVVALVMLWRSRTRQMLVFAVVGGAIALVLVAPWLAFNEAHYHALTASSLAKSEQLAIVNPTHMYYSARQLPAETVESYFHPGLPAEWGGALGSSPVAGYLLSLVEVFLVPLPLLLFVAAGWRRLAGSQLWLLALPWLANVLVAWYITVGFQFETGALLNRYSYPTLPLLAAGGVLVALEMGAQRIVAGATLVVSAALFVVWIDLLPQLHLG